MEKSKVIRMIKILFDRAEKMKTDDPVAFAAEIGQALNKARELMHKYQVEMTDVQQHEDKDEDLEFRIETGAKSQWQAMLAGVIAKYTNCSSLIHTTVDRKKVLQFVGMTMDIEICVYTFVMVRDQIADMMKRERRRLRSEREANGFDRQNRRASTQYTYGYALGVIDYLKESLFKRQEYEGRMDLVVVKNPKVTQWMQENTHKGHYRPKTYSERGRENGYKDGHKVMVRKGVKHQSPKQIK